MSSIRSISELIDLAEPAWPLIEGWLAKASNHVELIPSDIPKGEETLYRLQVTTRSPLGTIALNTGGIIFDHGWLKLLGSGCDKISGDLCSWNGLGDNSDLSFLKTFIVAYDVIGGIFAINGGAFTGSIGNVNYFAPDTLQWEGLDFGYSDFVRWLTSGDLSGFYETFRWPDWKEEVNQLKSNQGISIIPPLWTKDGGPVANRSRKPISIKELLNLQQKYVKLL